MEQYIFIRGYKGMAGRGHRLTVEPVEVDGNPLLCFYLHANGEKVLFEFSEWPDDLPVHLLKIDPDLFKTAFQSFGYVNWMKEKASDLDDQGNPLYSTLTRTPETLIMYLMELGISSDTLMKYIYGPENKYLEYRYLVQEFGKML